MKGLKQRILVVGAILLLSACLGASWVFAHEGYFTTYNHHIEAGEFEVMLMSDFTQPSDPKRENDGHGDYFSQMLELEYAPTDQLAFEFMMEGFEDIENDQTKFTGFRYEGRYRLFQEEIPLNPMLYLEYEDLHLATRYKMEVSGWVEPPYEEDDEDPDRERILESRLILSQDIGPWNLAFNWINESDLNSGVTAFGYSTGFLYYLSRHSEQDHSDHTNHVGKEEEPALHGGVFRPSTLGFEFLGALGDTKKFDLRPSKQEHYFQPSIMFHVGQNSMLNLGLGIGLTKASDNIVRTSWGWMF